MSFLRSCRRPVRLFAALFTFSVCLVPMTAIALPQGQTSPLFTGSVSSPIRPGSDPSADYRAAANQLSSLGLDQQQIDTLWGRMGPQLAAQLNSNTLSLTTLDYLTLPYCHVELLDRYQAYAQENPELAPEDIVTYVNIGLDADFYTDIQEISDPSAVTALVNKYRALSPDYVPEVVKLSPRYGVGSLTQDAAESFAQMADAARLDGISLYSVSAYRSYVTQSSVYQRYISQSGQSLADTFSARPGHSEHQTGLAVDINVARTSAHFENTKAFAWLQEHCAQYGFLMRYPAEKEFITGYRFEPWHYRYVGIEIAQTCTEQGLTYDEYVARLPVLGDYQVPSLSYQGATLELGHGALLLDGISYLSLSRIAPALDWSAEPFQGGLLLSNGQHRITFLPGRYCQRDGLSLNLSFPTLELDDELYIALPDLCRALQLKVTSTIQGLDLSPFPGFTPIQV